MKASTELVQSYGAVLPCGGEGKRLRAVTTGPSGEDNPKPTQMLGGRELILYSFDLLTPSLVRDVFLVTNYKADDVKRRVESADLPHSLHFVTQERPGVLAAVSEGAEQVKHGVFVYANTDTIRRGVNLEDVLNVHHKSGKHATMVAAYKDNLYYELLLTVDPRGIVTHTDPNPDRFRDRPDETGIVNTGMIIMDHEALDYIDTSRWDTMQGIIEPLTDAGQLAAYVNPHVVYIGVNTPQEYAEAERFVSPSR